MRTLWLKVLVGTLALALPRSPARAVCSGPNEMVFAQYYSHVKSFNSLTLDPATFGGSFWALGYGNTDVTTGVDSGSLPIDAWIIPYPTWEEGWGPSIYGRWSQSSAINGCIDGKIAPGKPSEIMLFKFDDRRDFLGGQFAVAAVALPPAGWFDVSSGIVGDIALIGIPRPHITSTSQIDTHTVRIELSGPSDLLLDPGFYSDGSMSLHELVRGYRLFTTQRGVNEASPESIRDDWTAVPGIVSIGQDTTVDLNCTRFNAYFALGLVYESGFESQYLSGPSSTIRCSMCITDADVDGWSGDPHCGIVDCDDADPATHQHADEVNDGRDNQCAGDEGFGLVDEVGGRGGFTTPGDKTVISWPAQSGASGYQIARTGAASMSGECVPFTSSTPAVTDGALPVPGEAFYYVIRASAPHVGSWGATSAGAERSPGCF